MITERSSKKKSQVRNKIFSFVCLYATRSQQLTTYMHRNPIIVTSKPAISNVYEKASTPRYNKSTIVMHNILLFILVKVAARYLFYFP
jgi:hypothetical protein